MDQDSYWVEQLHCGCYDIFLQSVHTHPNSRTQSLKSSTPSFHLPDNPSMPNRANHATHNKVAMSDPHCQLAMYARYQLYSSGELKNQEGRVFGVSLRPKRHLLSGDLLWSLACSPARQMLVTHPMYSQLLPIDTAALWHWESQVCRLFVNSNAVPGDYIRCWWLTPKLGDHYSTHPGNYFVRYLGGSRSDPKV